MSKRRNRHRSLSSVLSRAESATSEKPKPIFGTNTTTSLYIPQPFYNKNRTIDLSDCHKQKIFNKNISFFRDNIDPDGTAQLYFMSSLRQNKRIQHDFSKTTQMRPFTVSMKRTMNQHCLKRVFDVSAKPSRVSTAYYRWHNKSGKGTSTCMQFQCSLRDYNMDKNPEEMGFDSTIKPIKYEDVEPKFFKQNELICPKQRRLFRMKGD